MRLQRARADRFVGRAAEQDLWKTALASSTPAFAVLWLHGPGGIGKSSLLCRFADVARESGIEPLLLDAHLMQQEAEPFVALLRRIMLLDADIDPFSALNDGKRRALLIDTAERLGPLEDWLRSDVLPQLPRDCLVVFAGRHPPAAGWLRDDGWADLMQVISLRNLSPNDGRALLTARGVPESEHGRVLATTHGHPLALSLVADLIAKGGDDVTASEDSPHVVRALLERFSSDVPTALHRRALYVAAHARTTNESVLRDAIPGGRAAQLFDWLQSLSFVQHAPDGVSLHDMAAEVLDADLRRRDPVTYVDIHTRLRRRALKLTQGVNVQERLRGATDLCWMYRFSPIARPLVDWNTMHSLYATALTSEDSEQIASTTRRLQGPAAAAAQAYWLAKRPDAFSVIRASASRPIGYIYSLVIDHLDAEAARVDPVLRAAFDYVERTAAMRAGEVLHLMHAIEYDQPHGMPRHAWLHVEGTLRWNCTPHLAWSFVQVGRRARDVVLPMLAQFRHFPGPVVDMDGKQYVLAGHDWRREPPSVMSERFADVELHGRLGDRSDQENPLVVLSEDAFRDAVRAALRDCSRPHVLAMNPLCRSRVVAELPHELVARLDSGVADTVAARLSVALQAAAQTLDEGAKERKLFQALLHTYIKPAPSQDIAAELVGLPFSTYRRYLAAAIARVTSWLWQREVCGWKNVGA